MRTSFALALLLLASTACTDDGPRLTYQSSVWSEGGGVGMPHDSRVDVGMGGATCQVHTATGGIGDDMQITDGHDKVVDGHRGNLLVLAENGAAVHRAGTPSRHRVDFEVPGLIDGQLTDIGPITAQLTRPGATPEESWASSIALRWEEGGEQLVLNAADADSFEMSANTFDGSTYVTLDERVYHATPWSLQYLGLGAHIAWDEVASTLYVSDALGQTLRGLARSGEVRWELPLDAEVHAIASLGGRAAVSVGQGESDAQLLIVDGETGALLASQGVPRTADKMTASADGRLLALILPEQVHFLRVD